MYVCITVFTHMQILSTGSPKLYEKKKLYNISAELYRDISSSTKRNRKKEEK